MAEFGAVNGSTVANSLELALENQTLYSQVKTGVPDKPPPQFGCGITGAFDHSKTMPRLKESGRYYVGLDAQLDFPMNDPSRKAALIRV